MMAEGAAAVREKSMANSKSLGLLPPLPPLREKIRKENCSRTFPLCLVGNVRRVIPGVACCVSEAHAEDELKAREERTENDVEWNIVTWMQEMGWIAERANVGLLYTKNGTPQRVGKPGQCDWRFKRNAAFRIHYMEIEIKAPGCRPDRHQMEYMASMRHCGIIAAWFDSLAAMQEWYRDVVV